MVWLRGNSVFLTNRLMRKTKPVMSCQLREFHNLFVFQNSLSCRSFCRSFEEILETEYFGGVPGTIREGTTVGQGQLQDQTLTYQTFFQATRSLFFYMFWKPGSNKNYRKQNMRRVFAEAFLLHLMTGHPWALSRLRWPGTPGKEPPRLKGPVAPEVFEQAARSGKVGGGEERCRDFGNQGLLKPKQLEAAAVRKNGGKK